MIASAETGRSLVSQGGVRVIDPVPRFAAVCVVRAPTCIRLQVEAAGRIGSNTRPEAHRDDLGVDRMERPRKAVCVHGTYEGLGGSYGPREVSIVRACYAKELGGCNGPLSREHYLSKCVQEHLRAGGEYRLFGAPWLAAGEAIVSINNTQARILCAAHNNALSDLDRGVLPLFSFLDEWRSRMRAGESIEATRVCMPGTVLERWMLKVLVGILVSGNAAFQGQRLRDYRPSRQILDVLFAKQALAPPFGLYMTAKPGARSLEKRDFRFAPIFSGGSPCGARCVIYGVSFVLLLAPYRTDPDGLMTHANYHPMGVRIARHDSDPQYAAELIFEWDFPGSNSGLQLWFRQYGAA